MSRASFLRRDATRRSPRRAGRASARLVAALVAAALPPGATLVLAQTASQITPRSFEPPPPTLGGAVVFSGQPGLEAPPGAERLSITVSGVTVEGGLPDMAGATAAVEQRLAGRRVPVTELFAAAQSLEEAYGQAGYVLARVLIPEQSLRDGGQLRLVVVNGFIESLDTSAVPDPVRGRVEQVIGPLVGQRSLKLGEIERRLLIAGDTYGVALRSALSAGDEAGGAVLTVEADYHRVTGSVGLDNTLSDELGTWTLATGVEINSAFNLGETIYFRASGYPGGDGEGGLGGLFTGYPRTRTLAAGAVFPIGDNGLTLNLEGTSSKTTPEPTDGIQTRTEFQRLSFRAFYPVIRSRMVNFDAGVIFDAQSEQQHLMLSNGDDVTFAEDKLRIFRLTGDYRRELASGAVLAARATASFGIDGLGARGEEDVDFPSLSRQGADADFQKLEVAARWDQGLREHLAYSIYGRAQTSFGQVMTTSEQFGIASFQELSTFDAGTLGGDSGWVVRGDLQSPWARQAWAMPLIITPYAFGATGSLHLEEPSVFEEANLNVGSLGVGLSLTAVRDPNFSDATLTFEYGRAYRDDDEPDENRFTVVGSFQF
jgi:hemolysin activation/secretion protein